MPSPPECRAGASPAILPEAGARGCPLQGCSHSVSNLRPGRCPQDRGQRATGCHRIFHVLLMVTLLKLKPAGSKHTRDFPGSLSREPRPPLGLPEDVCVWGEQNSESCPAAHCMAAPALFICEAVGGHLGPCTGSVRSHPVCPQTSTKPALRRQRQEPLGEAHPLDNSSWYLGILTLTGPGLCSQATGRVAKAPTGTVAPCGD